MASAERYDIRVEVGADFKRTFTWMQADGETPVDITGYSAVLAIRERHDDEEPLLELTNDVDGGLVLGDAAGTIEVHATAAMTETLPQHESGLINGVYDLLLTSSGGERRRLVEGRCRIASASSRPWEV